jgi:hypothetical protein
VPEDFHANLEKRGAPPGVYSKFTQKPHQITVGQLLPKLGCTCLC